MATPGTAVPGTVVSTGALIGPGGGQGIQGLQGLQGIQGPTAVSADTGNQSKLGSDSLIYTPGGINGFISKTAAYTLTLTDRNKYIICSGGSWTLTFPAASAGLSYNVRNDMGITGTTGTITLTPPAGTIDGAASLALLAGQQCTVVCDGTNWRTFGLERVVVLGTQDISAAVASATILLPAGYRMFELEFDATVASAAGVAFNAVLSTDGGATWANTTQYNWIYAFNTNQTTWSVGGVGATGNAYFGNMGSVATYCKCHVKLYPGGPAQNPNWIVDSGEYSSSASGCQRFAIYGCANLNRVNALQYYPSSGTINQSYLTVKGIV